LKYIRLVYALEKLARPYQFSGKGERRRRIVNILWTPVHDLGIECGIDGAEWFNEANSVV